MYSYETNGRGNTSATDAKLLERKSQFINLPAVTPEDDGKVLGVDKGKWQPVGGGGYDKLSGGNITEVDGKKYFTPLGAGIYPAPKTIGYFYNPASSDDAIEKDTELVLGNTYSVSIDGGEPQNYKCYEYYGFPILGSNDDEMFENIPGMWQIYNEEEDGHSVLTLWYNDDDNTHTFVIEGNFNQIHAIDSKYVAGGSGANYDMIIHYSIDPEGGYVDVKYPDETELANTAEKMKVCYDNNVPYSGKIAFLLDDDYNTRNYICHDVIGYHLYFAHDGTLATVEFGVIHPTNFTKVGNITIDLLSHTAHITPAN